jgi:phosphoenolpyruvate carboxykinase (GTP)
MLPFCGYNMADYFAHWLDIGSGADAVKLPKLFYVNWFRKGEDGKFLWPGYGENSRVLEWVFKRCAGEGGAVSTAIGVLPTPDAVSTEGLNVSRADLESLLQVDVDGWRRDLASIRSYYDGLGERMPAELLDELASLEKRLG